MSTNLREALSRCEAFNWSHDEECPHRDECEPCDGGIMCLADDIGEPCTCSHAAVLELINAARNADERLDSITRSFNEPVDEGAKCDRGIHTWRYYDNRGGECRYCDATCHAPEDLP